ncbi:MAG: hypothetical protein JO023_02555, partial [Chloroflexi bacterium]|nr:hypothetical protein [Chloroflexota bacterium]
MRAIVRSQPIPSANTTRTGARGQRPTAPSAQPAPSLGEAVLQLQRLVGNIAVQRLLQRAEVGASASNQRGAPVQRLLSGEAWFASQVQGRGIEPIHEQMLDRLRTHHARLGQARKEMEAGYAKDAQGFSPWSVYFQHATDLTTNLEE